MGDYSKTEIRKIAEEQGFFNAHKHDSQDICFIPDGDYAGYIERQMRDVEQYRKLQSRPLPLDLDYNEVDSLRLEARQKLNAVKPLNFGQAARISGVSPADITALMIYIETHKKEEKA